SFHQPQYVLFSPVHFHLSSQPVHDPVLLHPTTRVEFEFGLAVAPLVGAPRRQYFYHQLRGCVEMTFLAERRGAAGTTDPNDVGRHIVIVSEDHTRREIGLTRPGLAAPLIELGENATTGVLMMPVWLSGHMEISIDDLIAFAAARQGLKIG